ncbi:MAG: LysR family transcriptional regulator [Alphaproteobacteria bacterium]|jgi:LysR family transcriptional regulator for bpeEF and oprC|nr:LysR family transcriptional regulator [Alphaproteobacteria bacterium]
MDRLDVMRLYVSVVEKASFSQAARALDLSQPTVSKQVAALETRLGAQLLRRTSRGLSLTEAGRSYYESSIHLLDEFAAAEARVRLGQVAPSGPIRLATSAVLGRAQIMPRLPDFFARYPGITVETDLSDRFVNLVERRIDIAVRIGHLPDSSLTARRIGRTDVAVLATPGYLARHGRPETPDDLTLFPCMAYTIDGQPRPWEFSTPDGVQTFIPRGPVRSGDAEHIRAGVLAGIGLAQLPTWLFAEELAAGTVVPVLEDFAPPPYPISAVTPGGRLQPGRVRAFADFLAEAFAADPDVRIR